VQIVDVDVVGREARQTVVAGKLDPAPGKPAVVRLFGHYITDLRRQDPAAPVRLDRRTDDFLGGALLVDVGGVDEIDARIEGGVDDLARGGGVGSIAEHHRAETKRRNHEPTRAQSPVFDRHSRCSCWREAADYAASPRPAQSRSFAGTL